MQQLVFENFAKMTGNYQPVQYDKGVPTNLHRLIQAFTPNYWKIVNDTVDSTVYKKISPSFPLIVSRTGYDLTLGASSDVAVMLPSYKDALVLVVTTLGELYAVGPSGRQSTYYKLTVSSKNLATNCISIDAQFYIEYIFLAVGESDGNVANGIYYATLQTTSTTWTAVTGLTITSPRWLEVFKTNLYYTDTSAGVTVDRRLINYIDSSYGANDGLDLGTNWYVDALKNWDNNFLAIVAHQSTGSYTAQDSQYSAKYYLFLWNGLAVNSYDYAREIRGVFHSMAFKGKNEQASIFGSDPSILYVFAQQGSDIVAFKLHNFALVEAARISGQVKFGNNPRNLVAVEGNYFKLVTTKGVLWWDVDSGESFIGENDSGDIQYIYAGPGAQNLDYTGEYYHLYAKSFGTTVYEWMPAAHNVVSSATYGSNYVPIPLIDAQSGQPLFGTRGRGKIERITIVWDQAPPSTGDNIALTLTYKDELTDDVYHTFVATLEDSVANSSATFDGTSFADAKIVIDTKRGYLENIGALATELAVTMVVSPTTTTWVANIKKILVDFTQAKMQP